MKSPMIMTAGPTDINEKVRMAMASPGTNPDLDMNFFEFYKSTTKKLQKLLQTKNDTLILNGEGMLGLDAACCSLIEKGDKVLCIDNGIFGKGFGTLCEIYGGEVTYFKGDYKNSIDVFKLEEFLKENTGFKVATCVHCETPTGILNPIDKIGPLLAKHGIISIIDAVASLGGQEIKMDEWEIDIVLGGSQKAISSPVGLSYIGISEKAWSKMENRKANIPSFYTNLLLFKDWFKKREFPYTQPVHNIVANDVAFDICLEKNYILEHRNIGKAVRKAVIDSGLELYGESGYANTVTAIMVPENIKYEDIFRIMLETHNIMIAGSLNELYGKVFRIGHMGENCKEEKVYITLKSLNQTLIELGFTPVKDLHLSFIEEMNS